MILNHVKFCKVFLPETLILNEITFCESKPLNLPELLVNELKTTTSKNTY